MLLYFFVLRDWDSNNIIDRGVYNNHFENSIFRILKSL